MMKNLQLKSLILIGIVMSIYIHSQNTAGIGNWFIFNVKYNLNNEWSIFGESQLRSLKFLDDFHYYEHKAGVNYKINKKIKLSLGAGTYHTYQEGGSFVTPKNNEEIRLWPQLIIYQDVGKLKVEQRYRTELRFTSNGYKNRFRYRVGISYPFGNTEKGYQPFQISASNEIFFTDKEPYFERNRMLIVLNYKISKASGFNIGYLNQFDYRINDEIGRDFLQLGYFIEIFNPKKKENQSSDHDLRDD